MAGDYLKPLYPHSPSCICPCHRYPKTPQTIHESKILVSTLKINMFRFREREGGGANPNPKGKQQVCYLEV